MFGTGSALPVQDATCLFLGGAEQPTHIEPYYRKKYENLLLSVQHDFQQMVTYAAGSSSRLGRSVHHGMKIRDVLINNDVADTTLQKVNVAVAGVNHASGLFGDANILRYTNKDEVRHAVRQFLFESPTEHLILFMSGSGEQRKLQCKNGLIEESFMLPNAGGKELEYYTDSELTQDIRDAMPDSKRLYIVCHCFHSGGMLNTWELNVKTKKYVAMFASAEKDIPEESARREGSEFIRAFCQYAEPGQALVDIASSIQDASTIRPSFITVRPRFGLAPFLVSVPLTD